MKASEKFLIDLKFLSSSHGRLGCIACHKGANSIDYKLAHKDLIRDPSDEPDGGICRKCHRNIAKKFSSSLHYTLQGFVAVLERRSEAGAARVGGKLYQTFRTGCWNGCHATCGQCHVSRAKTAKGGLYSNHKFLKRSSMDPGCYSCHGARNCGEYLGIIGFAPAAHFKKKKMTCMDCHPASNFHGTGKSSSEMYAFTALPQCENCHKNIYDRRSKIAAHKAHKKDVLACEVCHAGSNNNCYGCHVEFTNGVYRSSSTTQIDFKIGSNPIRGKQRPYKYAVLRHIPIARDTFEKVAPNLLDNFDSMPTWKYSPTHNIQRITAQNETCNSCHGNKAIFLTADRLVPGDSEENRKVTVSKIPGLIKEEKQR